MHSYNEVLSFWFEETDPKSWWIKDPDFDVTIKERFHKIHQAACQCELYTWRNSTQGRVAEIIVLDQFSRNIYRDTPKAFSNDSLALGLAQEAVHLNCDKSLSNNQKAFLYMPYMHSESRAIHQIAERLFKQKGLENAYEFELQHKAIIDRFGRYPHRNTLLDRCSTAEEIAFLKQPSSSF